ncbi:MAG TPA: tetratricopeptide repeat protein [Candidatus Acidoferrales bacterium]|nr:tetratricopeptide repeat protein [Candidatus Acidoferrales bacterium]
MLAPKLQKELDQGKSALLSSKFEKASSDFQRAYQAAPGNPQVNFLLGVSFMALNNLRQADTYLGQAYSIYPRDPATLTAIGILRVKQSNFASAISSLKAAIGLNRKIYLPHLVLAGALLAENEFSESLQEARIALGQGKRQASEANFIVGEALARMGQNHAALKPLQEFVKDCPNDPAVTDARKLMGALVAKANVTAARTSP